MTIRSIAAASLAALLLVGLGCKGQSAEVIKRSQPITLEYWRVFDSEDSMYGIINAYHAIHPNITINYRKFRFEEYEKALLNALAEDKGPDLISLHNTWMVNWRPRLLPVPPVLSVPYRETTGTIKKETITVMRDTPGITLKQLTNDFIDTVAQDVVIPTPQSDPRAPYIPKIYGLPLSVDTPVLFYNRDLLNNAGIAQPAVDWKTFQEQVKKLTKLDETGAILQSAAALGTADNVERAADFLAVLMMQNGARMTDENGTATFDKFPPELAGRPLPPGAEALVFYTDFANPVKEVYTWNAKMPGSLEAFARGQTAFFFGYSYHLAAVRQLNPKLNFGTSTFPQIEGNQPVHFANYWVESVSSKTKHADEAWDFLQFATKAENVQSYLNTTGKPTALRALVNGQLQNTDLSVFAAQLPAARTWYRGSDGAATESAFDEMIRQMLAGEADPKKLIEIAATKVNQTVR